MLYWTKFLIQMKQTTNHGCFIYVPRGVRKLLVDEYSRNIDNPLHTFTRPETGTVFDPNLLPHPDRLLIKHIGDPFLVLQHPAVNDIALVEKCVNAVAVPFDITSQRWPYTEQHQLHVFPLYWWPLLKTWYTETARTAAMFYINGQRVDPSQSCSGCTFALDHVVRACQPLRDNCKGYPQLGLNNLTEEVITQYPFKMPEVDGEFLPTSQACTSKAFRPATVDNLAQDMRAVEDARRERNARTGAATLSVRVKRHVCPGCVFESENQKCHKNGLYSCHGPVTRGQLEEYANTCEPWMLHALYLSGTEIKDVRPPIKAWQTLRTGRYAVAGPTRIREKLMDGRQPYISTRFKKELELDSLHSCETDAKDRYVMVLLEQRRRHIRVGKVNYAWVCKALQDPEATTFKNLEDRYGRPELHEKLMALHFANEDFGDFFYRFRAVSWYDHKNIYLHDRDRTCHHVTSLERYHEIYRFRHTPIVKEHAQELLASVIKDWKIVKHVPLVRKYIAESIAKGTWEASKEHLEEFLRKEGAIL